MSRLSRAHGPSFIVVAAFLWGLDGILRRSLFTLPPSVIVFYEHLIGGMLITPFAVAALKKEHVTRKSFLMVLLVSFLSGLVGTLLFTAALLKVNFIAFSVVFLLQKLQPVFATATAALVLKEKVTANYFKWALLAIVAAYFVTFPGGKVNFQTGTGTILAALLAVGAAFAWGSSTALSRWGLLRLSHTLMTGLRFWLTTPLALAAVFLLRNQLSLLSVSTLQFSKLALIALSTGMVALWIYYRGLKFTQVKVSTVIELVFPLTAVAIDLLLYGTILALSQYLAATVLLFAIFQVTRLNQNQ